MPSVEYDNESKTIKRKFTPEWKKSGKVDLEVELQKYLNVLIGQNAAMVEYIELLHDEIDRLQEWIGKETEGKNDN